VAGELPSGLDRGLHQELKSRGRELWIRRALVVLLALLLVAALLNAFGQARTRASAAGPAATLTVEAPERLRNGLIFGTHFRVVAREAIKDPQLVLNGGWLDGLTLNTLEPAPAGERSSGDRLIWRFPPVSAGDSMEVWVHFQVNPTTVGFRDQTVTLRDGERRLATVPRQVEVLP
jgi:hypothetical protein